MQTYGPVLLPRDSLMPVSAETHGGLVDKEEFHKVMKGWATTACTVVGFEGGRSVNKNKRAQLLRIWQRNLSMGLLRGRVGVINLAASKIFKTEVKRRGVHAIVQNPFARMQLLGSLRRR